MKKRYLTKSRFKLALECPNKLYYTKKKEFSNQQLEDKFLQALAEGGFQVEELARLEYPDGVLIENNDWNFNLLVNQTNKLLKQKNVVIFEAAFKYENLFIRTDILVKRGDDIKLKEVKAKSYDPDDDYLLIGSRGGMKSEWKPYLFDIAFQRYVIKKVHPNWKIKSFLKLANKSAMAQVDGLNQLFRISKTANKRTGIVRKVNSLEETGGTVLGDLNVDDILNNIEAGKYKIYEDFEFEESIKMFSDYYERDEYFNYPVSWHCKNCEFKTTPENEKEGKKSGFKECWSKQKEWSDNEFSIPMAWEIWNLHYTKGPKFFDQGKFFLKDLDEMDLGVKPKNGIISDSERKWIQIEKTVNSDYNIFLLKEELKKEMLGWKFPLNFIDFETSISALPFNKGRRPYEQIAFQFSHHTVNEDGEIKHISEYINFEPGEFPNFKFIRALRKSLSTNQGSIFMYSNHENTVLNKIYEQLNSSSEADKEELKTFIKSISQSSRGSAEKWTGERNMIDLCEIIKGYYYNLHMGGSNSIKTVLPSALKSSTYLKEKYSQPIGKINLTSRNFPNDHIWLNSHHGEICSPYKNLPSLFEDWDEDKFKTTISEMESVNDGGAALTAYGKLQYTDMSEDERIEIKNSLLKYCELDTLAMVMIFEHLKELVDA